MCKLHTSYLVCSAALMCSYLHRLSVACTSDLEKYILSAASGMPEQKKESDKINECILHCQVHAHL